MALVPVQLYEAAGCLLLFLLLDRLARRGWSGGQLLPVYLSLYGAFRFLLEFLRGDGARGFWGPLSTSQWVALAAWRPCRCSSGSNPNETTSGSPEGSAAGGLLSFPEPPSLGSGPPSVLPCDAFPTEKSPQEP